MAGITNSGRVLQHRLEDRLKLARRLRDDLQHFRGRRLLLTRFSQFAGESDDLLLKISGGCACSRRFASFWSAAPVLPRFLSSTAPHIAPRRSTTLNRRQNPGVAPR